MAERLRFIFGFRFVRRCFEFASKSLFVLFLFGSRNAAVLTTPPILETILHSFLRITRTIEFCKQFNERSDQIYKKETPLSVQLTAMSDRSFTFDIRSPPTSYLILQAAGLKQGASRPSPDSRPVGYITPEHVYEIAKMKQKDDLRWHLPLEGIARSVVGTAKSMGVGVREEKSSEGEEKVEAAEQNLDELGY